MPEFVKIANKADLPPEGEAREFSVGEKMVCVANVGGTFSAMDNVCLHRGGPLGQGIIVGDKVVCPWHGWMWNPKTGEASHDVATKVAVYPVRIDGEDVMIKV